VSSSEPKRDYYEILGVSKTAGKEDIKAAFRSKASALHANKQGDEAAFKELSSAYEVLSDAKKRADYDRQVVK
jgi:DnaJ-class molecular chaperone